MFIPLAPQIAAIIWKNVKIPWNTHKYIHIHLSTCDYGLTSFTNIFIGLSFPIRKSAKWRSYSKRINFNRSVSQKHTMWFGSSKIIQNDRKKRSSHRNNSFVKRDTKSVCSDGNRIILYWNSTSHFLRYMVLIRLGRKALELLTTNEWDSSELNLKWMWGDLKLLFLVWLLYSIIQFTNNVSISKPKTYANI